MRLQSLSRYAKIADEIASQIYTQDVRIKMISYLEA